MTKGISLLHDYARAHTAGLCQYLIGLILTARILPLSDFHLFRHLKYQLGWYFKEVAIKSLSEQVAELYEEEFPNLVSRNEMPLQE